jgi:UDP-glucuronate 4-epimerase
MLAHLALDACLRGKTLTLYNGGEMYRDWTYVEDIADGVVRATDRRLGYEVINLGRGQPVHLGAFVDKVSALCGKKPSIKSRPMPSADVTQTFANIDKARRLLGYQPQTNVDDGIKKLHAWYVGRKAG